MRKIIQLTPAQAYSQLYCKKGTPLHTELHAAWKLYVSADEATLDKYHHLFPANHNPDLPFVVFQQVVLKEKVANTTEEELTSIEEYIETRFQEATELREHPWRALKVDDAQEEIDLERQYAEE